MAGSPLRSTMKPVLPSAPVAQTETIRIGDTLTVV